MTDKSSKHQSINNCIDQKLCSLSYITVDKIVQSAPSLGRGELIEKINVDGMFPYGLRSAPKVYNVLADALGWIAQHWEGVEWILHVVA